MCLTCVNEIERWFAISNYIGWESSKSLAYHLLNKLTNSVGRLIAKVQMTVDLKIAIL